MKDTSSYKIPARARFRVRDFILPVLISIEWFLLGFYTPEMKKWCHEMDPYGGAFDWPYPYILHIHWFWAIPFGITLSIAVFLRHLYLGGRAAHALLVVNWIALVVVPMLWLWGIMPHRMVQYVN